MEMYVLAPTLSKTVGFEAPTAPLCIKFEGLDSLLFRQQLLCKSVKVGCKYALETKCMIQQCATYASIHFICKYSRECTAN